MSRLPTDYELIREYQDAHNDLAKLPKAQLRRLERYLRATVWYLRARLGAIGAANDVSGDVREFLAGQISAANDFLGVIEPALAGNFPTWTSEETQKRSDEGYELLEEDDDDLADG